MADLYKNKYRSAPTRLQSWDYGSNAAYFVTICTNGRICYFGNIVDGTMQLSEIGVIANRCWLEIPDHFPFVKLGNHIVMPNHVHGIIIIDRTGSMGVDDNVGSPPPSIPSSPPSHAPKNKFGPQSQNLASIVRGFKVGVTINARKINPDFKWQSRYYDHIIRNEGAYGRISEYIIDNPQKWNEDIFHG